MPRNQRFRLYIISLTTFVLVASLLTAVSFFHIRKSYYTHLEQKLVDYNVELSSILDAHADQFSLLLESMLIGGSVRNSTHTSAAPLDQDALAAEAHQTINHNILKKIIQDNWMDFTFRWNTYSSHLFSIEDDTARLDDEINGPIMPPKTVIQDLAMAALEAPAFRIYCKQDCFLYRATPILFPDGSRSVLIMSSSLADIFLTFSKNNDANIAILTLNPNAADNGQKDISLLYSNSHALSNKVLQKVVRQQVDFTIGSEDKGIATISAVTHKDQYHATFMIQLQAHYRMSSRYKIAVIKDMTEEYLSEKRNMQHNLTIYALIILGGCGLLIAAFWMGISKKFRSLELALESQVKIVEDKVLIITFDGQGKISSISKPLQDHPAIGEPLIENISDLFRYAPKGKAHTTDITHSLSVRSNWESEIEFITNTGEYYYFIGKLSDYRHRTLPNDHYTLLFEDITDKKKIKEYLEEIKNLDKFRRELIAHVSHDLRTPLTSLRGHIETCLNDINDTNIGKFKRMLSVAAKNSEQLSRLVEQLFELSLLNETNVDLDLELMPIAEIVEDVFFNLQTLAADAGVQLDLTPKDSSIFVMADVELIERVFTNLIGNAIRHTQAGGEILVQLEDHFADAVQIKIVDTGIGIAAAELKNIFDSYYQASNSINKHNKNSGLGLAITKRIIELHESNITVSSEVGKGTCFSFLLKKAKPDVKAPSLLCHDSKLAADSTLEADSKTDTNSKPCSATQA